MRYIRRMRALAKAVSLAFLFASFAGGCAYPDFAFTPEGDSTIGDGGGADGGDDGASHDVNLFDVEGEGATDTGAHDAAHPDTTTLDGAPIDAPPDVVSATTKTCAKLGIVCPKTAPFCTLKVGIGGKWVNTCSGSPGGLASGDACDPSTGGCADGLNCAIVYPAASPMFECLPVCTGDADCPTSAPFCDWQLDGIAGGKQCGLCDPTREFGGAECGTGACLVTNVAAPPRCGAPGTHPEGVSCHDATTCAAGLVCVCTAGLGDDCVASAGNCRQTCLPYMAGSSGGCPGTETCRVEPGSDFAYCL
jgi:hypothetical protein